MTGGARIGVDIGGTFTDLVLALADGSVRVSKASSTQAYMPELIDYAERMTRREIRTWRDVHLRRPSRQ